MQKTAPQVNTIMNGLILSAIEAFPATPVATPMKTMSSAMSSLTYGDEPVIVPGTNRMGEAGPMAKSFEVSLKPPKDRRPARSSHDNRRPGELVCRQGKDRSSTLWRSQILANQTQTPPLRSNHSHRHQTRSHTTSSKFGPERRRCSLTCPRSPMRQTRRGTRYLRFYRQRTNSSIVQLASTNKS
jgi:hypothetical protein